MHKLIKQIMLFLFVCISYNTQAEKVDKKGTLANSECKPIGTKCKANASAAINYTYTYNEPHAGSFSISIDEVELQKNESLRVSLSGKAVFELTEEMPIEADVIRALKMPKDYIVPQGKYPIVFRNAVYTIVFTP